MTSNNMDTSFYQLLTSPLAKALPALLEKVYQSGNRAVVLCDNEDHAEELTRLLWTYSPLKFLPHGSKQDANPDKQPIYLTSSHENPANAKVLVVLNGETIDIGNDFFACFTRVLDVFDGTDAEKLAAARNRWKQYKKQDHTLCYWQQSEGGTWEKGGQ